VPEFLSRCLKTGESTSLEQAQAFYTKFWKLHVDSSSTLSPNPATTSKPKPPNTNTTSTSTSATANNNSNSGTDEHAAVITRQQILNTSADPDRDASAIPFKQRIRPGMVVQHTPPNYFFGMNNLPEGKNFALVLCPVSAVPPGTCDLAGNLVVVDSGKGKGKVKAEEGDGREEVGGGSSSGSKNDGKGGGGGGGGKWLAAVVLPAIMAGTYTVHMWKHIVVSEDEMDAEVLMEYDEATRVYYMIV
jgi:kinesin family member 2/24